MKAKAKAIEESASTYWDSINPITFLAEDRENPARAKAAQIIRDAAKGYGKKLTLLEFGPGNGIDYELHFCSLVREGLIHYRGLEGSSKMVGYMEAKFPEVDIEIGTFADLKHEKADIIYAKAVFEHQPHFKELLPLLLRSAQQLAIINWYLPPGEEELIQYDAATQVYYNRYRRADVTAVITKSGFAHEISQMEEPPKNALYICTRMHKVAR